METFSAAHYILTLDSKIFIKCERIKLTSYFTFSGLILNNNEVAKAIAKTPQSLQFDYCCTVGNITGFLSKE